jgi:hypothetical protein
MTGMPDAPFAALKDAVIRVGDWLGFLVERQHGVLVITAAHCLTKTLSVTAGTNPGAASMTTRGHRRITNVHSCCQRFFDSLR